MGVYNISKFLSVTPGQSIRLSYWFGNAEPKGPMLGSVGPIQDPVTTSNLVEVTQQGFSLGDGCVYTADINCEDVHGTGAYGVGEFWVQTVWPSE